MSGSPNPTEQIQCVPSAFDLTPARETITSGESTIALREGGDEKQLRPACVFPCTATYPLNAELAIFRPITGD